MCDLFNPARIISRNDVPTFYSHGTRAIEFLDERLVRCVMCEDMPVGISGLAATSRPVAVLLIPVAFYVWSILAHSQHAFDHGLLQTKPRGPAELRPSRLLMQ